uniref:Uncharacterized protein n=1 Tax=Onchocerca volvulus TaxID=6282 RepID=A0A8R1TJN8_ONCVO
MRKAIPSALLFPLLSQKFIPIDGDIPNILTSTKPAMNNLIQHHERLYQFIKHKERVLKAKPVVETRPRSKSMSGCPRMSLQKRDKERRIQEENERLLKSLLKISERKPKYL